MTTPTAAATAPSRAVKPIALLFPEVAPVAVDWPPTAVLVLLPPRAPVAVAGRAVVPPSLPKPVSDGVVVEPAKLPVLFTETGYPASAQSVSMPNKRISSEKVYLSKERKELWT